MKKLTIVMAVIGCIMAEVLAMSVSAEETTTQPDDTNYGTDHCCDWMYDTTQGYMGTTDDCKIDMEETTEEWFDGTSHCLGNGTNSYIENPAPCSGEYNGMHWEYANYVLTISGGQANSKRKYL